MEKDSLDIFSNGWLKRKIESIENNKTKDIRAILDELIPFLTEGQKKKLELIRKSDRPLLGLCGLVLRTVNGNKNNILEGFKRIR